MSFLSNSFTVFNFRFVFSKLIWFEGRVEKNRKVVFLEKGFFFVKKEKLLLDKGIKYTHTDIFNKYKSKNFVSPNTVASI